MATKYTILETSATEESDAYSRKERAVRDADQLAQQYPGVEFAVATSTGKVVHKVKVDVPEVDENVDPAPVDDVPEVQVDAEEPTTDEGQSFADVLSETMGVPVVDTTDVDADFDPEDPDNDVDADFEPESDADIEDPDAARDLNTYLKDATLSAVAAAAVLDAAENGAPDADPEDGDEPPHHGLEVVSAEEVVKALAEQAPAPAAPATPVAPAPAAAPQGATLELCAPNTNAKRMHYRPIGQTRTVCGSANTSRRANAHQIETASLCPNCEKLAKGETVDTRPAGAGRGTRRSPKRMVVDAGEIRDLVAHLKQGIPYTLELTDGTRVEVVGGDPATKELDEPEKDNLSDVRSLKIVSA